MRELTVPEIEDPDRFFPDPVLVRPFEVRRTEDGYGSFHHDDGSWERIHPICLDILAGLEKGLDFDGIVDQCQRYPEQNIVLRQNVAHITRKYLWKLHKLGYVRYDLEEPPKVFHDRYVREKELGRGGLGIAHLCTDRDTGRQVVVKHPWGMKAKITSGQEALAVEIALMRQIQHPGIPQLYDTFTVRGLLHVVREYVDGRKLSSLYGGRPSEDRATRLVHARQVATILGLIHDAGWLFFDPSPDNFFLTPDGQIIATDLGGCKPHENGVVSVKGPRGTAGYVASEMRRKTGGRALHASIRSDVYSFGCLYYYMTTGHRPGRTWRHAEIIATLPDEVPHPNDRDLIERCTRDDPDARPRDMAAVLDLLR